MAHPSTWQDGLDYSSPDTLTAEEVAAFREHYVYTKGYSIPAFEFWLDFRADVLKRYRASVPSMTTRAEPDCLVKNCLTMLHHYAIVGYEDGILYEVRLSQRRGATRGEVLDTLAIAFLHGGPLGSRFVATSSGEFLKGWTEEGSADEKRWPAGWSFDPHAFDSGIDFSSTRATREDMDLLIGWYKRTLGEVPRYVRFYAEFRPDFLKAYRNRLENVIRGGLPKQMLPYLLLNFNITRGNADGIRENVLLARAVGVSKEQLVDAFAWASIYAGVEGVSLADEVAGDILRSM